MIITSFELGRCNTMVRRKEFCRPVGDATSTESTSTVPHPIRAAESSGDCKGTKCQSLTC